MQLVLFKIPEYSRQCKIPHTKIPSSTCCITQDKQSGIVFCHSWPTPILEWFRDTKDSEGNSFRQIGPLIRLLVAGDLAYAGIVEKPSVEEMGSLISVVSKGAVSGLNLLGLLPDKKTKHSKYPPTQVVNAFKLLFDRLKEALDAVEWNDMGLDTIVLEHSLCKLKRMKGPLGLLANC